MKEKAGVNRVLDDREMSILRAIIHDYIATGKPVGSRSFVQKYSLSISPATMRNIMFDLEGMEFLMQPHTSAGRIPTDRGYRFYVNTLIDSYDFSKAENVDVSEDVIRREPQLDRIFSLITRMLSMESKYAGVMLTPRPDFTVVKRIVLVPIDAGEVLVVLVTRTGTVISRKVFISDNITQDVLHEHSRYLSGELCGYAIYEIKDQVLDKLRDEKSSPESHAQALDILELAVSSGSDPEIYIEGIENLLRIPEMVENDQLQSILSIIEDKNILKRILERNMESEGIMILIGGEIEEIKVAGCSMVSVTYKIGNKIVGVLGVLGPTRMDYEKVVPLVDYTGRLVSDLLTKMSK